MKLILLAAAAVIATPVIAQTSGSTGTASPVTTSGAKTPTPPPADAMSTPPADAAAPAPEAAMPAQDTAPPATDAAAPAPAPMTTGGTDPVGGYAPTAPAVSGGTPGAPVVFRPAPTPDQAYPAPAPLAKYPVCKKGQFDKCRNPGGK